MSQMSTTPVFACRICKKPVVVTHLSTTNSDPQNELLLKLMKAVADAALCPFHRKQYEYYASQERGDEFLMNPHLVLYSVNDESGLDYYGRNRS